MNLRRKLAFFMALSRYVEMIVSGIPPLSLAKAKANSLTSLKAFGGTALNTVPNEYTEIEYIESTGTQYIDTGVKSNSNSKTEVGFVIKGWSGAVFGNYSEDNDVGKSNTLYVADSSSKNIYTTDKGSAIGSDVNKTLLGVGALNTSYVAIVDWKNKKASLDGVEVSLVSTTVWQGTRNQVLFARTAANGDVGYFGKFQISYCKIWDNGILARDLVPVKRKSDSAVGMYDKVSGLFFGNAGTGTFTAGNEVLPTTSDPMDIYCNNGKISVLDHTNWNVITNPNSETGKGMFINTEGKLSKANDRGSGVFIPITVGKKYTLLINKKNTALGSIIRYGQSNNGDLPNSTEQLLDWYRGSISDGMMISFTAKRPYFVMQLAANFVEAGGIDEAVEVIEAAGDNETIAMFGASYDNAYDEVPYLQSSTTGSTGAYIDTGFKPDSNTKIQAMFSVAGISAAQCLVGARNQSSGSSRNAFAVWANVGGRIRFDYQSGNVQQSGAGIVANTDYIVIKDGRYNTIDGVAQSANDEETFTCDYNMALFGINTADSIYNLTAGKIYYCKIWDNGTLVRDFVPVRRRSDGELGMYDKVNSVFYANAGTGDFTTSYQTATANNLFAIDTTKDVQEIITGATTHNCGFRVLDGTENWTFTSGSNCPARFALDNLVKGIPNTKVAPFVCSHFIPAAWNDISIASRTTPYIIISNTTTPYIAFTVGWDNTITDLESWQAFLAAQYAAGTPVVVVFPLETPYTEVAPIAQSMTVVDGDNTVSLTQQGMTPLTLEATYQKAKY